MSAFPQALKISEIRHCQICHADLDSTQFEGTTCTVGHEFQNSAPVFDVTVPEGVEKDIYFAQCCDTVLSHVSVAQHPQGSRYVFESGEGHCYSGPHIDDSSVARNWINGVTIVPCKSLGCWKDDFDTRMRRLKSLREQQPNQINRTFKQWAIEDREIVASYASLLPGGVGVGEPVIFGKPYKFNRVMRARNYFSMLERGMVKRFPDLATPFGWFGQS